LIWVTMGFNLTIFTIAIGVNKRNKMSKTSEGLEPHLYFPIFGVDREIPPDEPGMECPHKTVLMTKLNDESILVCEDCGEDVTEEIIG